MEGRLVSDGEGGIGTAVGRIDWRTGKRMMAREKIPGTIRIWPGTAEELVGTKAFFIRAGLFKDVDVVRHPMVARIVKAYESHTAVPDESLPRQGY